MSVNVNDKIKKLSPAQRKKVEAPRCARIFVASSLISRHWAVSFTDNSSTYWVSPRIPNPEQVTAERELKAALETLVDALPLPYRSVFVLVRVAAVSAWVSRSAMAANPKSSTLTPPRGVIMMLAGLMSR